MVVNYRVDGPLFTKLTYYVKGRKDKFAFPWSINLFLQNKDWNVCTMVNNLKFTSEMATRSSAFHLPHTEGENYNLGCICTYSYSKSGQSTQKVRLISKVESIPFIIKADYHETCKLHLNKSQLAKTKLAGLALWEMHAWGSLHMEFKLMASPDNIISLEEHVWTKTYRPLEMRACSCHDAHCLSNWQWNFFRMHLVYWQLW